jgi:hypothetical protein
MFLAIFYRYGQRETAEFLTLEEAINFLTDGENCEHLSATAVYDLLKLETAWTNYRLGTELVVVGDKVTLAAPVQKTKPKSTAATPLEEKEQQELIKWCEDHQDKRLRLIYSHLNGMRTSINTAKKAKRGGARKGLPDLFLPVACGGMHGMYIELKRTEGGKVSPEQKMMMALLWQQGYYTAVAYGWKDAARLIEEYLGLDNAKD